MRRTGVPNINTPERWDRFYEIDQHWDPSGIVSTIARFVRPGQSILDVGVGQAVVFQRLAGLVKDLTFMGCDFSPVAIEGLKNRTDLGFEFERLFVHDIRNRLAGPLADVVIATEVLEHLDKPVHTLPNIVALAKTMIIVTVPCDGSIPDDAHLWEFSLKDVRKMLKPYGVPFVKHVRRGLHIFGKVDL